MGMDDLQVRSTATDKFSYLIEFSPSMAREFVIQKAHREVLFSSWDFFVLELILRTCWLQLIKREKGQFLHFFSNHRMQFLTAPCLTKTSEDKREKDNIVGSNKNSTICPDNYQTAELLALILELLSSCVEHHTCHIKIIL
ncbi:hypothetical protein QTO34_006702 [Cnephaeus nilssonii]|uniref:Serine/threonine-protein phosphatase 4 regulatory subunit 3-like central domain-containing protein n=1 Tax=Cnephaeus nilssonii TaxID=3371016 RepID=A0AA40LHQ0_CNENI|nr:hypothetical protein QTO34_006702 [Eptesicus nilssonii]